MPLPPAPLTIQYHNAYKTVLSMVKKRQVFPNINDSNELTFQEFRQQFESTIQFVKHNNQLFLPFSFIIAPTESGNFILPDPTPLLDFITPDCTIRYNETKHETRITNEKQHLIVPCAPRDSILILFSVMNDKFTADFLRLIHVYQTLVHNNHVILICHNSQDPSNPFASQTVADSYRFPSKENDYCRIETFGFLNMCYDISASLYHSRFIKLNQKEITELMAALHITVLHPLKVYDYRDPMSRFYDLHPNDVIRIIDVYERSEYVRIGIPK